MPRGTSPLPDWAYALGQPAATGAIRRDPEDFEVIELPAAEPEGTGTHLWLEIRKRNANTQWIAERLAAAAGVPVRDVGFAGMKDRRAVTTQWFSVALQEAADPDWRRWDLPDAEILRAALHPKKLRRGALKGNRFRLVIRELRGDVESLGRRLDEIGERGVPNYFGPQRFGRNGDNVVRAIDWLRGGRRPRRRQRTIYLSAVRSWLFNQVLSSRVDAGNWDRLVDGDVAMLDGSRSVFACRLPDPELDARCAAFDLHPTGPLPGRPRRPEPEREAAGIEAAALTGDSGLVDALAGQGVEAARRSLRLRPAGLEHCRDGDALVLSFSLPPGAYATSLLRELVSTGPATISEAEAEKLR